MGRPFIVETVMWNVMWNRNGDAKRFAQFRCELFYQKLCNRFLKSPAKVRHDYDKLIILQLKLDSKNRNSCCI